ncbi:hypothetical protein ACOME3_002629 [Neoechinorhynchus agilis]
MSRKAWNIRTLLDKKGTERPGRRTVRLKQINLQFKNKWTKTRIRGGNEVGPTKTVKEERPERSTVRLKQINLQFKNKWTKTRIRGGNEVGPMKTLKRWLENEVLTNGRRRGSEETTKSDQRRRLKKVVGNAWNIRTLLDKDTERPGRSTVRVKQINLEFKNKWTKTRTRGDHEVEEPTKTLKEGGWKKKDTERPARRTVRVKQINFQFKNKWTKTRIRGGNEVGPTKTVKEYDWKRVEYTNSSG